TARRCRTGREPCVATRAFRDPGRDLGKPSRWTRIERGSFTIARRYWMSLRRSRLGLAGAAILLAQAASLHAEGPVSVDSFYALKTTTLSGQPADLRQYKGKVAVVVKVASQCGFTPQYAGLEKLYEDMKDKGVVVLGFPSNDFGSQEPGTPEEIGAFCKKNYGVTFPMFSKLVTKAGPDQSPIYSFLGQGGQLPD